jgi:hypothetical protein
MFNIPNLICVCQLIVTADIPSSLILVTLMMEVLRSYEMSVLTRATWYNIQEYGILHSHRCENFKYCLFLWEFVESRWIHDINMEGSCYFKKSLLPLLYLLSECGEPPAVDVSRNGILQIFSH